MISLYVEPMASKQKTMAKLFWAKRLKNCFALNRFALLALACQG
jgi:hypothetical protein